MAEPIDVDKPKLKPDEIICDSCWAVSAKKSAVKWCWFNFKYLAPVWLCPKCLEEMASEMVQKQRLGI